MAAPVWLVLGPPASGKGTQAEILARHLGAAHLSSGQALRETRNPAILARLASGELARTEDFLVVVGEALAAVPPEQPVVLDAVGRMLPEAEWLLATLDDMSRPLRQVICIQVDADESRRRAEGRGRSDDDATVQPLRWQRFVEETVPVLDFYRARGLLVEVDGNGAVDEVAARVAAALSR